MSLFKRLVVVLCAAFCIAACSNPGLASEGRLSEMSLEEKVGQIMLVFFEGGAISENLEKFVAELRVGGVILYSSRENIESVEQVAKLSTGIQRAALSAGSLPLLIAIDQEGGLIARIREGVAQFPGNMALGAADDPALAAKVASVSGRELASLGINVNLAPVMDVNNNPSNPIIGVRSFGSDPALVSRLGVEMIRSCVAEGVLPAAKHFPGHGDTSVDSHTGLPVIEATRERLDSVEFPPFRAAVEAGVPIIMTAHVLIPSIDPVNPATLSPAILGVLREEMGFNGLIVTDSMGMGALAERRTPEDAAIAAFNAGADILLFGADKGHEETEHFGIYSVLLEACRTGRIPSWRLDEAVSRILEAKRSLGLLDEGWKPEFAPNRAAEGAEVAREAALKSITVARDSCGALASVRDGRVRPLLWPSERASAAERLVENLFPVDLALLPGKPDEDDIAEAVKRSEGFDYVLVADYDGWRNPAWLEMIRRIGPNRVILLALRTPYSLISTPDVAAAVIAYSDNPPSLQALGEVLKDRSPARGRLPVDLPGFQRSF